LEASVKDKWYIITEHNTKNLLNFHKSIFTEDNCT